MFVVVSVCVHEYYLCFMITCAYVIVYAYSRMMKVCLLLSLCACVCIMRVIEFAYLRVRVFERDTCMFVVISAMCM